MGWYWKRTSVVIAPDPEKSTPPLVGPRAGPRLARSAELPAHVDNPREDRSSQTGTWRFSFARW